MRFSILMPTLASRRPLAERIQGKLRGQIERHGLEREVELLALEDDGALPVGRKRNLLVAQARGTFLAHVDDDDDVSPDYLGLVLGALHTEPDALWALRDVGFELRQGEVLGLVGHNGAGKSVLLKILSRVTRPSEGWARMRGRVASLLEAGAGFHPELTGRENVFLSGAILGMREAEIAARFDQIVDFAGAGEMLDAPLKRYSSGMSLRLAFSVAAHLDADVMLIDEVLAVGDEAFRRGCVAKMRGLARSGRAVVFVSHELDVIPELCDRALLLSRGRVAMEGDPAAVVARHRADATAGEA